MSVLNFKDMVEKLHEASRKSNIVFKASLKGTKVEIEKKGSKFTVLIDGEELDSYNSQKEAETMANQFVKQYKR